MVDRKKKLKLIQLSLLFFGLLILYLTYYQKDNMDNQIISDVEKTKVIKQTEEGNDVFYNIEYTGLDLNGNRYILKSSEAFLDKINSEIVYMKFVEATFYFKDNTILYIWSDNGVYNNKTFDMDFENNVKAEYLESKLFAGKASFSNTNNYLTIYDNVKIDDIRGNLIADKLLFDISKQKLDITSFNDGKINANLRLDEKRF